MADNKTRVWIEIGDSLINADNINFIQRLPPPTQGCMFSMINGAQLKAEGANIDQIKSILGFNIDGEKSGEN
jgi:hypothetical protein